MRDLYSTWLWDKMFNVVFNELIYIQNFQFDAERCDSSKVWSVTLTTSRMQSIISYPPGWLTGAV